MRGLWGDLDFLEDGLGPKPKLKDTQFADYHGHGWNFRAVYKRDRHGHLLDKDGKRVSDRDPAKFRQGGAPVLRARRCRHALHGLPFLPGLHGNGHDHGEVAKAVEIHCQDCHGTPIDYPTLRTTGPAAPPRAATT